MLRYFSRFVCGAFIAIFPCLLSARDLPKTDPDRKAILDAARAEPTERMIVKDLFRDGDFAWLCALKSDASGELYRTDESIEVYFTALHKQAGVWQSMPVGGSFAGSADKVDCGWPSDNTTLGGKLPQSADNIRYIWKQTFKADWLDGIAWGKLPAITSEVQSAIKQGLVEDASADTPKEALSSTQINMMSDRCKKQKSCLDQTQQAILKLASYRTDPKVSAVVWNNCRYGLRLFNPLPIEQCVTKQSKNIACKPGQFILKDRVPLGQCINAIHDQCKQDIKDPQARSLACAW